MYKRKLIRSNLERRTVFKPRQNTCCYPQDKNVLLVLALPSTSRFVVFMQKARNLTRTSGRCYSPFAVVLAQDVQSSKLLLVRCMQTKCPKPELFFASAGAVDKTH